MYVCLQLVFIYPAHLYCTKLSCPIKMCVVSVIIDHYAYLLWHILLFFAFTGANYLPIYFSVIFMNENCYKAVIDLLFII